MFGKRKDEPKETEFVNQDGVRVPRFKDKGRFGIGCGAIIAFLIIGVIGSIVGAILTDKSDEENDYAEKSSYNYPSLTPTLPRFTTPPLLTPPSLRTTSVPAGFTTHTDDSGLFSISYPSDWETVPSMVNSEFAKLVTQSLAEDVLGDQTDISLKDVNYIFFAGLPSGDGWDPNVSINLTPNPAKVADLDSYSESKSTYEWMDKQTDSIQIISIDKAIISGHTVAIATAKITRPGYGSFYSTQTNIVERDWIWTIGSGGFSSNQPDARTVIKSLVIKKG